MQGNLVLVLLIYVVNLRYCQDHSLNINKLGNRNPAKALTGPVDTGFLSMYDPVTASGLAAIFS
jgi:hypothetical protein